MDDEHIRLVNKHIIEQDKLIREQQSKLQQLSNRTKLEVDRAMSPEAIAAYKARTAAVEAEMLKQFAEEQANLQYKQSEEYWERPGNNLKQDKPENKEPIAQVIEEVSVPSIAEMDKDQRAKAVLELSLKNEEKRKQEENQKQLKKEQEIKDRLERMKQYYSTDQEITQKQQI